MNLTNNKKNVQEAEVAKVDPGSETSGDQTLLIKEEESNTDPIVQGHQLRKTILPPVRTTPEVQLPIRVLRSVTTSTLTTQQSRRREQCSAKDLTTCQSYRTKARPLQDLQNQLLGHQYPNLRQLQ